MPLTRAAPMQLRKHSATDSTAIRTHFHALHYCSALFVLCLLYAMLRYNVLSGVAWAHLPLFVANKAVSLAGVILFTVVYVLSAIQTNPDRILQKKLGLYGYSATAMHSLMSLLLMHPAYYPKLFGADGSYNVRGEAMLLLGVLAFALFTLVAVSSITSVRQAMEPKLWFRVQKLGLLALLPTLGHVVVLGAPGWFRPNTWPGGMPPITLLSSCIIVLMFAVRLRRRLDIHA